MKTDPSDDEFISRESREYPHRTVAVAILVDEREHILLVRTHRLPNHWQPLGGGVKPTDESPRAAVLREVGEEAGLTLKAEGVSKIFEADYDFGEGTVHFFVAPSGRGRRLNFNKAELLSWKWFSLKDSLALPVFPATSKCLAYLATRKDILIAAANRVRTNRADAL